MAKSHDQRLGLQPVHNSRFRLVGSLELLNQFHRSLVRSAVQWASQRPDRTGDGRENIGHRGSGNSRGKCRCIEFMFGVQNQ